MNPNQSQNPYDFIMNPTPPPSKLRQLNGNKKLIIIGGILGFLMLLMVILTALIPNRQTIITDELIQIAIQQNELIQMAEIGAGKARSREALELAITTQLSLSSQQRSLLAIVQNNGRNLRDKDLVSPQNTANQEALDEASQNNQFDEVFIAMIEAELQEYQQAMQRVYNRTSNQATKEALAAHYNSAALLAGEREAPAEEARDPENAFEQTN